MFANRIHSIVYAQLISPPNGRTHHDAGQIARDSGQSLEDCEEALKHLEKEGFAQRASEGPNPAFSPGPKTYVCMKPNPLHSRVMELLAKVEAGDTGPLAKKDIRRGLRRVIDYHDSSPELQFRLVIRGETMDDLDRFLHATKHKLTYTAADLAHVKWAVAGLSSAVKEHIQGEHQPAEQPIELPDGWLP